MGNTDKHTQAEDNKDIWLRPICFLNSWCENWDAEGKQQDLTFSLRGLLEKYPTFGREKETGLLGALDT